MITPASLCQAGLLRFQIMAIITHQCWPIMLPAIVTQVTGGSEGLISWEADVVLPAGDTGGSSRRRLQDSEAGVGQVRDTFQLGSIVTGGGSSGRRRLQSFPLPGTHGYPKSAYKCARVSTGKVVICSKFLQCGMWKPKIQVCRCCIAHLQRRIVDTACIPAKLDRDGGWRVRGPPALILLRQAGSEAYCACGRVTTQNPKTKVRTYYRRIY